MANIKQFWIVAPVECPERAGAAAQRMTFGAQEAPRPRADRNRIQMEAEAAPVANDGFGYVPDSAWTKKITHVFTTKTAAEEAAKDAAAKQPKVMFGVFECQTVYETTTPQVIQKQFKETGELVVK